MSPVVHSQDISDDEVLLSNEEEELNENFKHSDNFADENLDHKRIKKSFWAERISKTEYEKQAKEYTRQQLALLYQYINDHPEERQKTKYFRLLSWWDYRIIVVMIITALSCALYLYHATPVTRVEYVKQLVEEAPQEPKSKTTSSSADCRTKIPEAEPHLSVPGLSSPEELGKQMKTTETNILPPRVTPSLNTIETELEVQEVQG